MVNKTIQNFDELIEEVKTYIVKEENLNIIRNAYQYASEKHANQFRKSGEPYIVHILQVAYILAQLKTGPKTIAAGLLHDVIEDCAVTKEEFVERFGEEVYTLVESVTKIGNLKFNDEKEYQAHNHRKIMIAMAKDIRVILIKLVDRLHNMRTLQFMSEEKQKKIASETLEVYAPIAHRLGISEIKNELEDHAFYYLKKENYYEIARLVEMKKTERDSQVNLMLKEISDLLTANNIKFRIFGRSKHLYSIYKKMTKKQKRFEEILDLLAIRIITDTDSACYEILGHIHAKYVPIPGRFKDYIAVPKVNLYRSLHTTIMSVGNIFEVQIRTEDMDIVAEKGIAAHWRYKEGNGSKEVDQKQIEDQLAWFKEFSNMVGEVHDNALDYMNLMTNDIFEANVYVMSPKGKIVALPNGACPIDFAYRIHTEVGHKMVGATINGAICSINTPLKTGDVVDIKTSNNSNGPSEDWLKIVVTSHARNKIRAYFQKIDFERKSQDVKKGEEILKEELIKRGFEVSTYFETKKIESVGSALGCNSYVDLMYAIANKSLTAVSVVEKLTKQKVNIVRQEDALKIFNRLDRAKGRKKNAVGIKVPGIDTVKITLSSCCTPIPSDEIVGYISKGMGIKVHRSDCPNIKNEKTRLIPLEWEEEVIDHEFEVKLKILSTDRNHLLTDIVNTISQNKATMLYIETKVQTDKINVITKINVIVRGNSQLSTLLSNLRKISSVKEVQRIVQ